MRILLPLLAVLAVGPHRLAAEAPSAKSPDGKRFAQANDKTLVVSADQRIVFKTLAHDAAITALAFSPDGKLLASADKDGKVNLLDAATGKLVLTVKSISGANKLAFSANGRVLEVKSPTATKQYDPMTGREK
jgi:WD40 repeat protein